MKYAVAVIVVLLVALLVVRAISISMRGAGRAAAGVPAAAQDRHP